MSAYSSGVSLPTDIRHLIVILSQQDCFIRGKFMLALISSIPTTVREGFDLQDLPPRASTLSPETLTNVFGGNCLPAGVLCASPRAFLPKGQCCPGLKCKRRGIDSFCSRI